MKSITKSIIVIVTLIAACLQLNAGPGENQGHHQSGIIGRVAGGILSGGEGIVPNIVRVFEDGELIAEVETEVVGNDWWHFEINLKPGDYVVTAATRAGHLFSYPVNVTVEKKQFTHLVLGFAPVWSGTY